LVVEVRALHGVGRQFSRERESAPGHQETWFAESEREQD